jgi:single-stranded-DNA-specific exonuclease
MPRTELPGLRALIDVADLTGKAIDAHAVAFRLAPRLNASGRLGHARDAVRLLTVATPDEARGIAQRLDAMNRERQETERRIFEDAARRAEEAGMTGAERRAIVLADPAWHPGVVGIVCSRLTEAFGRPAILLCRDGDQCRGSARSIDGYSMHAALEATAGHLLAFGGHEMAAGLSLRADALDAFTEALVAHATAHIAVEEMTPPVEIDCDAGLGEMTVAAVQRLAALAPFGRANRAPIVRVAGATLAEEPRPVGGAGKHLSLRVRRDEGEQREVMRGVWWSRGALATELAPGARLDLAVEPRINEWNGAVNVELHVRDVALR